MNPTAINYNPSVTLPCECVGTVSGCLDPDALNFYKGANTDSGTCTYGGCTDSSRPNYNPTATIDDGRCAPLFPGCTNPLVDNYNALYNLEDGSCRIAGCMAQDAAATFNVPCLCNGACAPDDRRKLSSSTDDCWDRLRSTTG